MTTPTLQNICELGNTALLDVKMIPLSQGKFAIVDADMYDFLMQWKWNYCQTAHACYALTKIDGFNKYMHRVILSAEKGQIIDHINGDTIDNRRSNLRICTNSQNLMNRKKSKGSSKYKGVTWFKRDSCWKTQIMINYVNKHIGYYPTEEQAAIAYNDAAKKYFKEFARLNII